MKRRGRVASTQLSSLLLLTMAWATVWMRADAQPPEQQDKYQWLEDVSSPRSMAWVKEEDERSAKVEILDRKTKVLLIAGGPMREFIFLRNQLYRDRETEVDVLLQSAWPGISQDAHEVLYEFPKTAEELFAYDCIVAFDQGKSTAQIGVMPPA